MLMNEALPAIRVGLLMESRLTRDSVARALRSEGFQVVGECKDGLELIHMLEIDRPNVVVVDLLPSGQLELIQQLHDQFPDVRLLLLCQTVDSRLLEQCLQAGASGFLNSTLSGCESLFGAIRSLFEGTQVLPGEMMDQLLRVDPRTGAASSMLSLLSAREREVLGYVAAGADNLKIASMLGISERTVKAHVSSLYRKLVQENRTQLALLARQLGVRPVVNV